MTPWNVDGKQIENLCHRCFEKRLSLSPSSSTLSISIIPNLVNLNENIRTNTLIMNTFLNTGTYVWKCNLAKVHVKYVTISKA